MVNPSQTNRVNCIDAFKGVCIIFVVLAHVDLGIRSDSFIRWYHSFCVAGFFITAGWLYSRHPVNHDVKALIRNRFVHLGVPYICFSVILLLVTSLWVAIGYYEPLKLLKELYKTVCLRGIGTLWFLVALFFGEIVFVWIVRFKDIYQLLAVILFFAVSKTLVWNIGIFVRSYNLDHTAIQSALMPLQRICEAWPVIYTGYWCGKGFHKFISPDKGYKQRLFMFAVGCVILAFSVKLANTNIQLLWSSAYDTIWSAVPSIGFILIFHAIEGSRPAAFFSYWGRNSLVLMCTHFTFTLEICHIFDKMVLGYDFCGGIRPYIYFVTIILVTCPMVRFFNSKAPWMIGKAPLSAIPQILSKWPLSR